MRVEDAFVVFDQQDSGCLSYGVERAGRRWFVKTAAEPRAAGPMTRVVALHRAVRHPAIVRPVAVLPGPTLVYPWCPGRALNAATVHGGNRSALERFRRLPADDDPAGAGRDPRRARRDRRGRLGLGRPSSRPA